VPAELRRQAARLVDDIAVRRRLDPRAGGLGTTLSPALWARDDLVVEVRWQGAVDLDVALVHASGERNAAHAPRGAGARVRDRDQGDGSQPEVLAVRKLRPGRYRLEVASYAGSPAGIVRGELTVRALRAGRRTFSFELRPGAVAEVAEVEISRPRTVAY
jgi:hypothetical protein